MHVGQIGGCSYGAQPPSLVPGDMRTIFDEIFILIIKIPYTDSITPVDFGASRSGGKRSDGD